MTEGTTLQVDTDANVINVLQWARDKGILNKATPKDQFTKTVEEVGELAAGLCRYNPAVQDEDDAMSALYEIKDAIGDVTVTLIILADLVGAEFSECLDQAYEAIAGRTGKMVDGVFVKDDEATNPKNSCKECVDPCGASEGATA